MAVDEIALRRPTLDDAFPRSHGRATHDDIGDDIGDDIHNEVHDEFHDETEEEVAA